jgi:multidrug efflux pump
MSVDQDQARLLGVSSQVLAQSLSAVVSGIKVTQLRDGIYLIDVVARANEQERISPDALRTLQIPIPNGGTVPLLQLATVETGVAGACRASRWKRSLGRFFFHYPRCLL